MEFPEHGVCKCSIHVCLINERTGLGTELKTVSMEMHIA